MKKKALFTVLTASLMCAAAAVTFAACGETKTYSVTYVKSEHDEGGSVPTDATKYKEGAEVTVKGQGELVLTNYEFSGWVYDGKTYKEGDKIKMPGKNITLTASWSPIPETKYTVSFEANVQDATLPEEFEVVAGTEIDLSDYTASLDGYKFVNWLVGTTAYGANETYTVTGDVTLKAVLREVALDETITLNATYHEEMQTNGTHFTGDVDDFGYWYKTIEITEGEVGSYYTLTVSGGIAVYLSEDDFIAGENMIEEGDSLLVKKPADSITLYIGGSGASGALPDGTADTSISGKLSILAGGSGKVTFKVFATDYRPLDVITVDAGGTVTDLPADPSVNGYTFEGWYLLVDGELGSEFTTDTVIESDITVVAKMTERPLTIVLLDNETDTEGVTLTSVPSNKLSEIDEYPASKVNANGFAVKEWAVKGNADVKATSDTYVSELLDNATDNTITLYAIWSNEKTVADYTANGWTNLAPETVNISYGQTVTVTGDLTPVPNPAFDGSMQGHEGIFVSVGKVGDTGIKVTRRYDICCLNGGDNPWNGTQNTPLGVKLKATNTLTKEGEDTPLASTTEADLAVVLTGTITDYTVVVDYTSVKKITVTTTFTSTKDSDVYHFEGILEILPIEAHVGLVQTYTVGISGETDSKLENGKIVLGGDPAEWAAPNPDHDWTVENDYKCTVCDQIDPAHPHNWTADHGWQCTYCGKYNPAHEHNFVDNVCTICEGTKYEVTVGETTYVAALKDAPLANLDESWNWWDGVTDRVEIGEGDWVAYIKWEKVTSDPNYYDYAAEVMTEEAKNTNSLSWDTDGRFRIDPTYANSEGTGPFNGKLQGECVQEGDMPANDTENASLGQYTALFVRVGNTITFSVTCEREGAFFWSRTCTIDGSEATGKLYLQITGNPYFLENLTCASASLSAVTAD